MFISNKSKITLILELFRYLYIENNLLTKTTIFK